MVLLFKHICTKTVNFTVNSKKRHMIRDEKKRKKAAFSTKCNSVFPERNPILYLEKWSSSKVKSKTKLKREHSYLPTQLWNKNDFSNEGEN